jgi:hypothetical protein
MGPTQWNEAVFVDGKFRAPSGGGVLSVRDKASGEIFAVAGLADVADAGAAVAGGSYSPNSVGAFHVDIPKMTYADSILSCL